jgi:very-short-patch-repair endonuclease
MNPIARHFLPSVIRGVYRYDVGFSEVKDEDGFRDFSVGKRRFLPCDIADELARSVKCSESLELARSDRSIPENLLESQHRVNDRARAFFKKHAYFKNAVLHNRFLAKDNDIEDDDNFLEIHFVRKILAPLLTEEGLNLVRPQRNVGTYLVDFAIEGQYKLAFEIDGFGKFKSRQDLDDFLARQNYITAQNWRVIRFTYGQVMESTEATLREVYDTLKKDPQLRNVLAVSWHTGALQGLDAVESHPSAFDLVNDFYRIQDWFVELAIAESDRQGVICVEDAFGHDFPFVASAISALFEFLDAVSGIVDVEFKLPSVEVLGGWQNSSTKMHPRVVVGNECVPGAHIANTATVRERAGAVPLPPSQASLVRLKRGMSIDEICQRLDYFVRNIFGFAEAKRFQAQVLKRVFDGKNVLGISATGSGKSFCFWLPALLKPGLTLVIAPLRSLMRDQKLTLLNLGIASAEYINSDVDYVEQRRMVPRRL